MRRAKNPGLLRVRIPPRVLFAVMPQLVPGRSRKPVISGNGLGVRVPLTALIHIGRYANRIKQAVCKTVAFGLVGSNPTLPTYTPRKGDPFTRPEHFSDNCEQITSWTSVTPGLQKTGGFPLTHQFADNHSHHAQEKYKREHTVWCIHY